MIIVQSFLNELPVNLKSNYTQILNNLLLRLISKTIRLKYTLITLISKCLMQLLNNHIHLSPPNLLHLLFLLLLRQLLQLIQLIIPNLILLPQRIIIIRGQCFEGVDFEFSDQEDFSGYVVSDVDVDEFGVHSFVFEYVVFFEYEDASEEIVQNLLNFGVGGTQFCCSGLLHTYQGFIQYVFEFQVFFEEVSGWQQVHVGTVQILYDFWSVVPEDALDHFHEI